MVFGLVLMSLISRKSAHRASGKALTQSLLARSTKPWLSKVELSWIFQLLRPFLASQLYDLLIASPFCSSP